MKNTYFKAAEELNQGNTLALEEVIDRLVFNQQGLIPVITQDAHSKTVLMLAWMNSESLAKTLSTGLMTYWSRSREKLWVKGETSGHFQQLESMRFDCDGDALLCLVNQTGAACHTGREDCFYFEVDTSSNSVAILSSRP